MPRLSQHTRRTQWLQRALVVCVVATAAVGVTLATVVFERQRAGDRQRAIEDAAVHSLERELAVREAALRGAQGLIAASERVETEEFRRFGRLALGERSETSWHPVVRAAGRAAFERTVAPIAALDAAGNRRPVGSRDMYLPEALDSTPGGGGWSLGVDLLSDPSRAAAARRAIDSGNLAVSGAVPLPTPSHPEGLVLVLPVYGASTDVPPLADRRARLSGVVVDTVPLSLLERRVSAGLPDEVSLVIEAGGPEPDDAPGARTTVGGQWIHLHLTSSVRAGLGLPAGVGGAGLAIVLLTAMLMRQASRRDGEVRAALARQSEARHAAESALRLREDRFRVLAQEVPVGICILTPDGLVEFANQRCAELMGVSVAGLVGETLMRPAVSGADRERFGSALDAALRDGERLATAVWVRHPNGDQARLRVQAVPAGAGDERRHLCTVTDITDEHMRELREHALAEVAAVVASDPGMEAVLTAARDARAAVPGGTDDPAFAARIAELITMARSAAEAKATLTARAERDPLTGLANRRVFWDALRDAAAEALEGRPSALVLLDLDHFKRCERHPRPRRGRRRAPRDRGTAAPVRARLGPDVPRGRRGVRLADARHRRRWGAGRRGAAAGVGAWRALSRLWARSRAPPGPAPSRRASPRRSSTSAPTTRCTRPSGRGRDTLCVHGDSSDVAPTSR